MSFFSNSLIYLNPPMIKLMKISTRNTVPIPIRVFIPAFIMFSPTVYSGAMTISVTSARSSVAETENSIFLWVNVVWSVTV